MIVDGLLR